MARKRRYLETDVLTEARGRLRHTFDIFDTVVVMFSGGKDSMVCLHLVREIAAERGIETVNVVFRDEELIPDSVVETVDHYRRQPWIRMLWFAVPLKSQQYVLGVARGYVQWDRSRRHIRQIPPWAIQLPPTDPRVFDQYSMDAFVGKYFEGKVAFVTGIRASESLIRFRSCVNKLSENYIVASSAPNVQLVRPIYDWEQDDVFLYMMREGITYCQIYDSQLWAGAQLRVSTPLHAETAKRFHLLKVFAPTLYAQVVDVFPEMLAHERYYRELDHSAVIEQYGQTMEGVKAWILKHIKDKGECNLALDRFYTVLAMSKKDSGAYPPSYLLKVMMAGGYKRMILPVGKGAR